MYRNSQSTRSNYVLQGKRLNKPLPPIQISKDELHFQNVIRGTFGIKDIHEPLPREVRLFLSSTFSDFKVERNTFIRKVLPDLKQVCNSHGLDLHLCDMRWGITDSAVNEHLVEKLCLQEIERCRKITIGPFFVLLVGNRYGYQPIPSEIVSSEFEIFMEVIEQNYPKEKPNFDKWYRKDENSVPVKHVLLPIKTYIPGYGDYINQTHREAGHEWWKVEESIRRTLNRVTKVLCSNGKLTMKRRLELTRSVTETELATAIKEDDENDENEEKKSKRKKNDNLNRCVAYDRELTGLSDDLQNESIRKFIDYIFRDGEVEQKPEAAEALSCMRSQLARLGLGQYRHFNIAWHGNGVSEEIGAHRHYLQQLSDNLLADLKNGMVKRLSQLEKNTNSKLEKYKLTLQTEVIQHWLFAKKRSEMFCGRHEELRLLGNELQKNHKQDSSWSHPVIVHGDSGNGKTALLAQLCLQQLKESTSFSSSLNGDFSGVANEENKSGVMILRFLGTSANSTTLYQMLYSVCQQIQLAYHLPIQHKKMTSLSGITSLFNSLLQTVSRKYAVQIPLTIILDSLDQLVVNQSLSKSSNQSIPLYWLPIKLPRGITIIISIATDTIKQPLFQAIKTKFGDKSNFIEVGPMKTEDLESLYEKMSIRYFRKLTDEQKEKAMNLLQRNSQALYIKLILTKAFNWTSFQPINEQDLASTIDEAVNDLFIRLETTYGKVFIQCTLSYLTIGLSGLSEIEIEDLLSLNDSVLNEVYEYHDPPVKGVLRIPSLLWARVHSDLMHYMVHKWTDNKLIISWYHRQMNQCAEERYLQDKSVRRKLHSEIAQYYAITGSYRRTTTLSNHKRTLTIPDADRLITNNEIDSKQPRRLRGLAYHSLESDRESDLIENCVGNFRFLSSFMCCFGINELINWLGLCVVNYSSNLFISIIKSCITYLEPWIDINDPRSIAVQLVGYFRSLDQIIQGNLSMELDESKPDLPNVIAALSKLCSDCIAYLSDFNSVIPCYACFPTCLGSIKLYKENVTKLIQLPWEDKLIVLVEQKQNQNDWSLHLFDMYNKCVMYSLIGLENEPINVSLPKDNKGCLFLQDKRQVMLFELENGHKEAQHGLEINGKQMLNQCLSVNKSGQWIAIAAQNRIAILEYRSGEKHPIIYKFILTAREVDKTLSLCFPESYSYCLLLSAHISHSKNQKTFVIKLWQFEQSNELWSLDLMSIQSQMVDTTYMWPVYNDDEDLAESTTEETLGHGQVVIILSNGHCFFIKDIMDMKTVCNLTNSVSNEYKRDNRERLKSISSNKNSIVIVRSSNYSASITTINKFGQLILCKEIPANTSAASCVTSQSDLDYVILGTKLGAVKVFDNKINTANKDAELVNWQGHRSQIDFLYIQAVTQNDDNSTKNLTITITTYSKLEGILKCWIKHINPSKSNVKKNRDVQNYDSLFDTSILENVNLISWSDNKSHCVMLIETEQKSDQLRDKSHFDFYEFNAFQEPFSVRKFNVNLENLPQNSNNSSLSNEIINIESIYSVLSNKGLVIITKSKIDLYNKETGELWSTIDATSLSDNIQDIHNWYNYDPIKSALIILQYNAKTTYFTLSYLELPNMSHVLLIKRFLPPLGIQNPQSQLVFFEPIIKNNVQSKPHHFVLFNFNSHFNAPNEDLHSRLVPFSSCCLNLLDSLGTSNLIYCNNPEDTKKINVKKSISRTSNQSVYSIAYQSSCYPITNHQNSSSTIISQEMAAVLSDSQILIGGEGEILIWDLDTGNCRVPKVPYFHTWFKHSLSINVNICKDKKVPQPSTFQKHPITALLISSECELVVSGCSAGYLVAWWWYNTVLLKGAEPVNVQKYRAILDTKHKTKVTSLATDLTLKYLVSGSADMHISLTSLHTNQCLHRLRVHGVPVELNIITYNQSDIVNEPKDQLEPDDSSNQIRITCNAKHLGHVRPMLFSFNIK